MPKKFKGENSKAVIARARKEEARLLEKTRIEKEKEDEFWKDDDKHVAKKANRKADREKKRLENVDRKKDNQKLLEEEETCLEAKSAKPAKMTRADIKAQREREAAEKATVKPPSHIEAPLEENPNIAVAQQLADEVAVEARSVEEAIAVLSVSQPDVEKHPEKRMKAAYTAFEEENLPILKAENPNLRLSQLKQMLKKQWQKSPDNPMNRCFKNYNQK
ncbi:coiled-coil domain-containing protein 124-like [Anneissia japonica]|uniref:coiled-coil domain-containing protein 124-like n=1 Tax=Anneissia japonica TaxID=1529436 RepID=UPI001425B6FC|nr:coiled-coil domain-containing protein 124-like [Anneissia japonica]XP_033120632.1 coiled-coil domain-containing protein 124-like [Anneissia japonica]XP_033120633.1 coiled-coil domain-containing protein 124-like [Anneissia japonica]XP_033120634.1 coiled-coil domain-containing protein 124-like [Anneissia japonica]